MSGEKRGRNWRVSDDRQIYSAVLSVTAAWVGWIDMRGVIHVGGSSWREGEVVSIPVTPSPVHI